MNTENNNLIREFIGKNEVELVIPFSYELGEELPTSNNIATLDNVEDEIRLEIELEIINEIEVSIKQLDFDNDYNLLMEVVDFIEEMEINNNTFTFEIQKENVTIFQYGTYNMEIIVTEGGTRLENLYNAVLEWIELFNQNQF